MRRFIVRTDSQNKLGLCELCQRYCQDRWIATNLTPGQAADAVLDEF